jgi:hypothetical protein
LYSLDSPSKEFPRDWEKFRPVVSYITSKNVTLYY